MASYSLVSATTTNGSGSGLTVNLNISWDYYYNWNSNWSIADKGDDYKVGDTIQSQGQLLVYLIQKYFLIQLQLQLLVLEQLLIQQF